MGAPKTLCQATNRSDFPYNGETNPKFQGKFHRTQHRSQASQKILTDVKSL